MDAAILEAEALKLSEQDRAVLVDHLQKSLSSGHIAHLEAHVEESHSRFRAFKAGEMDSLDGRSFVENLRTQLES